MIALRFTDGVDQFGFDLVNENGLQLDDTLESEVAVLLFTDARATEDELRFYGLSRQSNRGWFGDSFPDKPGWKLGSKLWLLARAPKTDATLAQARDFANEALSCLVEDQVASRVIVDALWTYPTLGHSGLLAVDTEVIRPGKPQPRWRRLWGAIGGEILETR